MPPPTNSSDNRAQVNTGKRSGNRVNEGNTPSSPEAQILLTALCNVIVPLVQTALPTQKDLREVPFGPEAQDLLVALQKFIASIIRDQSDNEAGNDSTALGTKSYRSMALSKNSSAHEEGATAVVRSIGAPNNVKQPKILTKALSVLRQYVFDAMPIRLLRFETYESKFEITLVEREKIYIELSERFQEGFDGKEAKPENIKDMVFKIARYSILSHTWLRDGVREVTYDDWLKGDYDTDQPGYQKLVNFCKAAADYGFTYGWMDTVCINKASSAELDESIRSMYKWYDNANICITYLAATTDISDMATDPWFTRGWTLQELIAPDYLKFYDMNWNKLVNDASNDKTNPIVLQHIESASTITHHDLTNLAFASISTKMRWAAPREVTRGEDTAYSLIGILNVNISIAYGEGSERAFLRLLKELLNTTEHNIIDIFNWSGDYRTKESALLPSSPKAYLHRYLLKTPLLIQLKEPLTFTHLGLHTPILLLSAVPTTGPELPYRCIGDFHATVNIETSTPTVPQYYNLLDRKGLPSNVRTGYECRIVFAVLNFAITETTILVPQRCFAVVVIVANTWLQAGPRDFEFKIPTKKPIFFDLLGPIIPREHVPYYDVERKDLEKHGMRQLSIYL